MRKHNYDKKLLTEVLEQSWKVLAAKKQVKEYDEKKNNDPLSLSRITVKP
jgi:hypothetical protein